MVEPQDFTLDGVVFTIHTAPHQLYTPDGKKVAADVDDVAYAVYLSPGKKFHQVRQAAAEFIRRPGSAGYGRYLRHKAEDDQRQTDGRNAILFDPDYAESDEERERGIMVCPKCRKRYVEWRWFRRHMLDRHGLDALTCEATPTPKPEHAEEWQMLPEFIDAGPYRLEVVPLRRVYGRDGDRVEYHANIPAGQLMIDRNIPNLLSLLSHAVKTVKDMNKRWEEDARERTHGAGKPPRPD